MKKKSLKLKTTPNFYVGFSQSKYNLSIKTSNNFYNSKKLQVVSNRINNDINNHSHNHHRNFNLSRSFSTFVINKNSQIFNKYQNIIQNEDTLNKRKQKKLSHKSIKIFQSNDSMHRLSCSNGGFKLVRRSAKKYPISLHNQQNTEFNKSQPFKLNISGTKIINPKNKHQQNNKLQEKQENMDFTSINTLNNKQNSMKNFNKISKNTLFFSSEVAQKQNKQSLIMIKSINIQQTSAINQNFQNNFLYMDNTNKTQQLKNNKKVFQRTQPCTSFSSLNRSYFNIKN